MEKCGSSFVLDPGWDLMNEHSMRQSNRSGNTTSSWIYCAHWNVCDSQRSVYRHRWTWIYFNGYRVFQNHGLFLILQYLTSLWRAHKNEFCHLWDLTKMNLAIVSVLRNKAVVRVQVWCICVRILRRIPISDRSGAEFRLSTPNHTLPLWHITRDCWELPVAHFWIRIGTYANFDVWRVCGGTFVLPRDDSRGRLRIDFGLPRGIFGQISLNFAPLQADRSETEP